MCRVTLYLKEEKEEGENYIKNRKKVEKVQGHTVPKRRGRTGRRRIRRRKLIKNRKKWEMCKVTPVKQRGRQRGSVLTL